MGSRPALRLELDPSRCTGCLACELACVEDRYGPVPGHDPHDRVVQERRRLQIRLTVTLGWTVDVCDHCAAHPCVTVCPHHALLVFGSGRVDLLEDRCTGCGHCVAACPTRAIRRVNDLDIAIKCDQCHGRQGGAACVSACPETALRLVPVGSMGG